MVRYAAGEYQKAEKTRRKQLDRKGGLIFVKVLGFYRLRNLCVIEARKISICACFQGYRMVVLPNICRHNFKKVKFSRDLTEKRTEHIKLLCSPLLVVMMFW